MVPAQSINPAPQPMMDPQQMFNFMSMFVPQFQQTFASSMNQRGPVNSSSLTSDMANTDSFSQYIGRRLHQSLPCHGSKGILLEQETMQVQVPTDLLAVGIVHPVLFPLLQNQPLDWDVTQNK
jgi:hypothetical protein